MARWLALGALTLNLGLAASYLELWARRPGETAQQRRDFSAFYTAAAIVHLGQGAALYDLDVQGRVQRAALGDPQAPPGVLPYVNPPHVAMAMAPMARWPMARAFRLWTLLELMVLSRVLWLVWHLTRERPALERWLACATVAAAPPILLTFELGAFSLLILLVVLELRNALVRGRDARAGLWLLAGSIKPQLVLMPALATLLGRRWRTVAVALGGSALVAIACVAALGPGIWAAFAGALVTVHRSFETLGIYPAAMYNLKGAVLFAFGPGARAAAQALAVPGFAAGCLLTAWIWRGPWRAAEARFDLQLAATLLVGTFFSLHLYWQDGLMLVAAGLLFDSYLCRSGRPRAAFATLACLSPLLWFTAELAFRPPPPIRVPVLLELVLGGWMARELARTSPAPAGEAGQKTN